MLRKKYFLEFKNYPHFYYFSLSVKERINQVLEYKQKAYEILTMPPRKVLILGSGGLSIGQAGEFDYSGSQVEQIRYLTRSYKIDVDFNLHGL